MITYRSAWLSDTQGPTAETTAAQYRATYVVGEATARITRTALTLGGAYGVFKGPRLAQLFRDGALATIQPPPANFVCQRWGFMSWGLLRGMLGGRGERFRGMRIGCHRRVR